jgi:hydroxypyruvate reductase
VLVREAAHPVPDAAGVAAADEALALCADSGEGDLVVALVSGGGSALWPAPPAGVTLDDLRATSALLLASGAAIAGVNAVRKHLSRVAGGRLAAAAAPAHVLALVLSDVTGDDPAVVAGGPTAADPTTFADAAAVLHAHGLWGRVPNAVRAHLAAGRDGRAAETVKPGAPALAGVRTRVVGTNADALAGAAAAARARGFAVRVVDPAVSGEARDAGAAAAAAVRDAAAAVARGAAGPTCLLWGGETTVAVRGPGRGGRNQECALAAALALERAGPLPPGVEAVYLAAGTDGVDGPTDAAGGWVAPGAAAAVRAAGADPALALAANDSHAALAALGPPDHPLGAGGLVVTGPTHTNVMDVHLALVRPAAPRP